MANKQEKEVAGVCVCGQMPCTVKHKSRYLVACPDSMACSIRGQWKTTEEAAIKSWNLAVQSARHERRKNGRE